MHSGESDFDPPRFKPNPSVYLKAAETEGKDPVNCIAVEDSGSGVGSASNAGVGECPSDLIRSFYPTLSYPFPPYPILSYHTLPSHQRTKTNYRKFHKVWWWYCTVFCLSNV